MNNVPYLIEIALLLLVFFSFGCLAGYLLRGLFQAISRPRAMRSRSTATGSKDRAPGPKELRNGETDNLKGIRGIGPGTEKKLNDLGIFRLDEIAAWDGVRIEWIEERLAFKGRVEREKWVEQARNLSGERL